VTELTSSIKTENDTRVAEDVILLDTIIDTQQLLQQTVIYTYIYAYICMYIYVCFKCRFMRVYS
jgi:hypothetical protein